MAQPNACAPAPEMDEAASRAQSVRDDIFAIFGGDQRTQTSTASTRVKPSKAKRRGKLSLAVLSLSGVAIMAAAGVLAGTNAIEPAAPKKDVVSTKIAKVTIPPHSEALLPPAAVQPVQLQASDVAVTGIDQSTPALEAAPTRPKGEVTLHSQSKQTAAPRTSNIKVVADKIEPTDDNGDNPVVIDSETAGRVSCRTAEECLQSRIRRDDQRVASSYEMAAAAGVRSSLLRDYGDEWIGARGLAKKRPQEAIRIYGMIDSDLRLLAADPTVQ